MATGLRAATDRLASPADSLKPAQAAANGWVRNGRRGLPASKGWTKPSSARWRSCRQGLTGFTRQVRDFMVHIENLATVANHLNGAVQQLRETLGDLFDQLKRR